MFDKWYSSSTKIFVRREKNSEPYDEGDSFTGCVELPSGEVTGWVNITNLRATDKVWGLLDKRKQDSYCRPMLECGWTAVGMFERETVVSTGDSIRIFGSAYNSLLESYIAVDVEVMKFSPVVISLYGVDEVVSARTLHRLRSENKDLELSIPVSGYAYGFPDLVVYLNVFDTVMNDCSGRSFTRLLGFSEALSILTSNGVSKNCNNFL